MKNRTLTIGIFGVLSVVWLCFCTGREVEPLLYGKWRCPHDDYKNTYFEIRPETIIFGNNQDETEIGTIRNIKYQRLPDKKWVQCTVKYHNMESLEYEFQFLFDSEAADTIVFKNQEDLIWTKENTEKGTISQSDPVEPASVPGIRPKKFRDGAGS